MAFDPISAIRSLDYNEREASFLYLAGLHSGYFLRRQYNCFIGKEPGSAGQALIEKGCSAGHIEVIEHGAGKHVYHLVPRQFYRLMGDAGSQNRRFKGDGGIRLRLMALDYVLENRGDHFLTTPEHKLDFFARVRAVPPALFRPGPRPLPGFVADYPISIEDRARPLTSAVRFAFLDGGLATSGKFSRFLRELGPLMLAVGNFEVVYTALSTWNFPAAEEVFRRAFEAQVRDARQPALPGLAAEPAADGSPPLQARFTTLLFQFPYPQLLRHEPRGVVARTRSGRIAGKEIA